MAYIRVKSTSVDLSIELPLMKICLKGQKYVNEKKRKMRERESFCLLVLLFGICDCQIAKMKSTDHDLFMEHGLKFVHVIKLKTI